MISKRTGFFHAAFVSAALLFGSAAGCGPAWVVVKQANPSPFAAQTTFSVDAVAYEGLKVGGKAEADYLAEKKPEQVEAWKGDLTKLNATFAENLVKAGKGLQISNGPGAAPAAYTIKPMVTFIEPGAWALVVNIPSEVRMTLRIADDKGNVVDEVVSSAKYATSSVMGVPLNPTVTDRLNECGKMLGESAAAYLRSRAGLK